MTLGVLEPVELTDHQFAQVAALVKSLCGIHLHDGKKELVKARLGKRLRALGVRSFDEYVDYVRADRNGEEIVSMLDAISTNLTSFFRESRHFEFLTKKILPDLVARESSRERRIRIWSAGCSTGEEPYSLAICLAEHVPGISGWDAKILATDLSTRVLAQARNGVYETARVRTVAPALLSKYFVSTREWPRQYEVKPILRDLVHVARLNLMEPWPMRGPFQAIFCRNVMIYFDKPTQGTLVDRFWNLLEPGGFLFLGHSESLTGVQHRFRYAEPTVYRKA